MSDQIETRIIHAGEPENPIEGMVCVPIFQSAMGLYQGETSYDDLQYMRLNNLPGHKAVHGKLADLEGSEAAVTTASGMAAITTTLLTLLKPGDHMLVQGTLYGGTHDFIHNDLKQMQVEVDALDTDPCQWQEQCRENTKVIYTESLTNPTLRVIDHEKVAAFAKSRGLISVIDSTFATPINFRPIEWGYDLVVHSATKYLNGHSDLVAGVVAGSQAMIKKITHKLNHLGGSLGAHAVFLLHRGLKTLAVRVREQNKTAAAIAAFLDQHPKVKLVNYPSVTSHPEHHLAQRFFTGFGGVLSFEPEDMDADEILDRLKIPFLAPSLGGVESLKIIPAKTSHLGMTPEERAKAGIGDNLIRMSIGLENVDDLIADLQQALA